MVLEEFGASLLKAERRKTMWSIWNAPSDLDYYGQSGFSGDDPEEEQEVELEPRTTKNLENKN